MATESKKTPKPAQQVDSVKSKKDELVCLSYKAGPTSIAFDYNGNDFVIERGEKSAKIPRHIAENHMKKCRCAKFFIVELEN